MKDFRFYEEFRNKRRGESAGTVVAVWLPSCRYGEWEGFVSVFEHPNCATINYCGGSYDYLRQNCKRISEERARQIHPNLFNRIEEA